MKIIVKAGDVLDEEVDVLICTANPWLAMSGGVNGAILSRGGRDVQAELQAQYKSRGKGSVPAGTVLRTGPGPLRVKHILHAVGVTPFYESSVELVATLLQTALQEASRLGAKVVATPAIATGYGPLSMEQFAQACRAALAADYPGLDETRVVLRTQEDADVVARTVLPGNARGVEYP